MIVEGKNSVQLAGQAWVVEDGRELAWAERHVGHNPAHKYVLGKYVEAETANDNGHIFDTKELETAQASIAHSPLNLLHHPQYIVGAFIASEMVYPIQANAGVEKPANAVVEALAAFWRYYFPEEYKEVERAHGMGSLFYSMEAIPVSVTCAAVCQQTYPYLGRQSDTYCAHLNAPAAARRLNQPHFMGGALIIPPTRPGWKGADITELSALISADEGHAEALYEGFRADAPHLSATTWEEMMLTVLLAADPALPEINTPQNLADAIRSYGRSHPQKRAGLKAHITRRAKALGQSNMLPDQWDA